MIIGRTKVHWNRHGISYRGKINSKGLGFYERLVDNLLAADIEPVPTLHHWDFPQTLQEAGGWTNRDSANWFADYAHVVFDALGDRVKMWITLNEPWVIAFLGYGAGIHAPGICDYTQAYQVTHHLLLAHGKTVQLFRQEGYNGEIGVALNPDHFIPASEREEDIAACQRAYDENVSLFMDPLYKGEYPAAFLDWLGPHRPKIQPGDLEIIHNSIDFLGVNYYRTARAAYATDGSVLKAALSPVSAPGWGRTEMDWGINPAGLTAVLLDFKTKYNNPKMYITEVGCAFADVPDKNDFVFDQARINFLREHFQAALAAIEAGADEHGILVWSLFDNFEWSQGYGPRFGLVRVDYPTGKRTPKQSAHWYGGVIANNGFSI